jgi:hypothetical protein
MCTATNIPSRGSPGIKFCPPIVLYSVRGAERASQLTMKGPSEWTVLNHDGVDVLGYNAMKLSPSLNLILACGLVLRRT